ncbi:two-component regulator propeller domain-containing protein [uncultured Formosa sp.]|uniref:hybrid sensor histidine kinase/response regulator transcription factor n=1 Tax=uncultured Formosa sp. TaxID=255435 RepID=UPI00262CA11D|nr:two-component regulator propeller domain-containing protein [uncultured Formosa sp.]
MNLKWYTLSVCFMLVFSVSAQYNTLKFENINAVDGLSSGTCLDIYQDTDGYLWFGTIDGLNKFNGYDIEVFRPDETDSTTISNIRINAITGDKDGNLWIGTNNGLNFLNKKTNRFSRVPIFKPNTINTINGTVVNTLLYDAFEHELWVGTNSGAVKIEFDDAQDLSSPFNTSRYKNEINDENSLDNNSVNVIVQDKQHNIWMGTNGPYLNKYNVHTDNFERVLIEHKRAYELNHISKSVYIDNQGDFWIGNDLANLVHWQRETNQFNQVAVLDQHIPINDIYKDHEGLIWVSTDGHGLYLFDDHFKTLKQHIVHNPSDLFSLPNNQPTKIFQDKNDIFWIGSYNKGVSKLQLSKNAFGHYYYQPNNPEGLNGEIVQSVLEDSEQRIWLGVYNQGLNLFNEAEQTFTHYSHKPEDHNSLSSNKILYTFETTDGYIWICTFDGGINRFNPNTGKFKPFLHHELDSTTLAQNAVWTGVEDSEHRIWLGLKSEGLNLYNPNTERFHQFKNQFNVDTGLASNFIVSLFVDSKNRLIIGTTQGLNVLDLNTLEAFIPEYIKVLDVIDKTIQGIRINDIIEDGSGHIWLAADNGLHKLDAQCQLLQSYTTKDGLPNNLIVGLAIDDAKNIWLSTKSGMSVFNPETHHFKNFNIIDGLQGLEYQSKSIEKTKDGRILAGGLNGFNIFDPELMLTDSIPLLTPIISNLRLNNRTVSVGDTINGRILLDQNISETDQINLKYNENNISFDFVALFLDNPNQVQYTYQLEGVDDDFVKAGSNRQVNYSNLQAGNYVFKVKASLDGSWDTQEASVLNLKVYPPFWKTWYAYLAYMVIIALLIWTFLKLYTRNVEDAQKHKLDLMKLEFFVNVSHEFRTPLTLILNPLDKILNHFKETEVIESSALTAQRSARRLLHLINQLLDYRKMDAGMAPLQLERGDIVTFTETIFSLFKGLAETKHINYVFQSNTKTISGVYDFDKVEKIITNLISNAIKYTDYGGEITVTVTAMSVDQGQTKPLKLNKKSLTDYVEISIKDTGRGMKKKQLEHVFSRFYNLDETKSGTGIGLHFTKGLVHMHQGEILVHSAPKKGSEFIVRLPIKTQGKLANVAHEKNEFLINSMKAVEYDLLVSNSERATEHTAPDSTQTKTHTVLIVEDNRELRLHLKDDLEDYYNVLTAEDGKKGLKKALKRYPDLIISDVMMPKMDGFDMCKALKSDLETSHIPIILLTARTGDQDQISGFDHGANAYVPKPFKIEVLRARIKNLLEAKARLREKFSTLGTLLPSSELTTNSIDEAFLEKVTKVVLNNISDQDFKIDDVLEDMGIGRSQFFRKIQSITGQNPSSFIRTIRLKYASELLQNSSYSIKEITHMSGFNSSTYFGKTFKDLFNLTPTEYINQNRKV